MLNLLSIGPIFKPLPFIKTIVKIRNFKPDLIIAGPFPTTISLYSLFFKKIYKSKLLVLPCFHHQDDSFQNPILFNVLKKSDFIWCLSSFEKIYLSKKLDISKNKFFISPPGLSITPLKKIIKKPVNSINLLFLGNFAAHKRIEVLLTAFNIICQQKDNLHLTIAGQKTLYYPQIEKTIKNLPKKTRTNLTVVAQKYNQKILTNLLDKSHIFINPSINESYGIVFAESAARGVPVIGSDIPTVKNLITSNRIGLCFAQNNPIDLAKLILKLTKDKSLYSKLSQNCLSYSRKLSWPAIISKLNEKIA